MLANVRDNPLSYGLAFAGALIWAAYCTVTTRIAEGRNGVALFFILVCKEAVPWRGAATPSSTCCWPRAPAESSRSPPGAAPTAPFLTPAQTGAWRA